LRPQADRDQHKHHPDFGQHELSSSVGSHWPLPGWHDERSSRFRAGRRDDPGFSPTVRRLSPPLRAVHPRRIDILTGVSGIEFDAAWASRECADLEGHKVGLLGREELILNKRAAGRLKDLADVENLEQQDR
jgi:hypothetical protein